VLDYGGKTTWTGVAGQIVPAKGYFVVLGTKKGSYPDSQNMMSQGLSANNANVNLTLFDPDGATIDYYEKAEDLNSSTTLKGKVHQRIPDGGTWYYTEPAIASKGAANPASDDVEGVLEPMAAMEITFTVTIESVTPSVVTPDDDVVIVAKVVNDKAITSVVLKWTKDGAAQADVDITAAKEGNNYTATIAKQADGTVVEYTIEATDETGAKASKSGEYTVAVIDADYTQLVLNEINGTGQPEAGTGDVNAYKYYELYNKSAVEIPLLGVKIYYDNGTKNLTWTGTANDVIPANGYFIVMGRTSANPAGVLLTGLSANSSIECSLEDPLGTLLDKFTKVTDTSTTTDENQCFQRIPNGTGNWYYTPVADNTKGTVNPSAVGSYKQITPAPWFGSFTKTPTSPTADDDVTVKVTVTTPAGESVGEVILYTTINSVTTNSAMSLVGANYEGVIAKQAAGETVSFYVVAKLVSDPTLNYSTSKTDNVTFTAGGAPTIDYTKLVLNEIDGNSKAVELYNSGTVAISLLGVTLWKNVVTAPSGTSWWTGTEDSGSIAPGAYVIIVQTGQRPGGVTYDVPGFIGRNGISTSQKVKFELLDPSEVSLGVFQRGDYPWGDSNSATNIAPNSFQRIPNATGDWKMAAPTNEAANAATGDDIPL
jgi:hypothetical protein